jgi:hypothetical protein
MNEHANRTAGTNRFTKNNYFYGKLLTVEDMATEQAYHARVQRTLSRFVTDWGGICGLDVSATVQTNDESGQESLLVTVSEGLALDRCGRLVVVDEEQHRTVPIPVTTDAGEATDTVAIYVSYDECYADPVPAAKMENACEQECKDNHIIEGAELTVVPGEPDDYHKSISEIEFPDAEELGVAVSGESIGVRGTVELGIDQNLAATVDGTRAGGIDGLNVVRALTSGSRVSRVGDQPTEVDIDVVLSETAPEDTVSIAISPRSNDTRKLVATVEIPVDTLIDPDGFTVPDGSFDVTGQIDIRDSRDIEFEGTLSLEPDSGSLTASANLDFETESGSREVQLEFSFDIEDGTFEIDGSIEFPEYTLSTEATVSAEEQADGYLLRGSAELFQVLPNSVNRLLQIDTVPWEGVDGQQQTGIYVDKPVSRDSGTVDLDAILSGLARSYYRNEPRTSCGDVDDGSVLVGTITATDEQWASSSFERGPLVYTNDMLFDILARHVSDFDNPHEVSLGVGTASSPSSEAEIGVEESEGLTGSVEFASPDGSVSITPDLTRDTIDLQTAGGVSGDYREYLLFERSLWTKLDVYVQIFRDSPKYDVPSELLGLLLDIILVTIQGLEEQRYDSPDGYVEFIQEFSIAEKERRIFRLLDSNMDNSELSPLTTRALDTFDQLLEQFEQTGEGAAEIAIAQDRVAESMRHYLVYFTRKEDQIGGLAAIRSDTVIDVTGTGVEEAIRDLRESGRVARINVVREDTNDLVELREGRINEVVGQDPPPGTTAGILQPITIDVVAPPSVERIDGIGPNFGESLTAYGIGTIGELSVATPQVVERVTGASSSQVEEWLETAQGYASVYELTRFDEIGTDEAEALYEAREWTTSDPLTDVAPDEFLSTLEREVERGDLKPKFRDRIARINWSELNTSIERLTDR